MNELERIWLFLRTTRVRARLAVALRALGLTLAAVCVSLLLLAFSAAALGPASFWPSVATGVLLLVTGAGLFLGWIRPGRRLRSDQRIAHLVGQRHPPVASDLLSAVELALAADRPAHAPSGALTQAFFGSVAATIEPLDVRTLVPMRPARNAWLVAMASLVLLAGLVVAAPDKVRRGFALLVRQPNRFEGAVVSTEPLVADVRVTYEYPAYTKLTARTVEGSSGDLVALKGTRVTLSMRSLRSARKAALLLGDHGELGEIAATINQGVLSASFTMRESGSYRVWLAPYLGRPVREQRAHRVEVETDRAPAVEIFGPADRLVLPAPRPVEVAFAANDDFGLGPIDLVWHADDGAEQRIPLRDGGGARTAAGKTIFAPTLGPLPPGATIAYRIEARDRDAASGAKVGTSRTLYLVIENPRENFDERVAKQKEILERLITSLADRLELGHRPAAAPTTGVQELADIDAWETAHETEESHVATLGRLIDEERRASSSGKALLNALSGIADRLGRLLREEAPLLGALRAKAAASAGAAMVPAAAMGKLAAHGSRHVDELENAVLMLDDLIGRQRLEDLAAAGKELTDAYKRLEDLLARYNATKDEGLRRQLERELRDLRQRIADLAQKIGELQARNEVPTEWQNMPDLRDVAEKTKRLDSLLEKGDTKALSEALADLGKALAQVKNMLEHNADEFSDERFPQENKAMEELLKKVSDLEGDERELAGDTGTLSAELEEELKKKAGEELESKLEDLKKKAGDLVKKVGSTPPRSLGETSQDELGRTREAAARIKRLLEGQELGEAKAEAQAAAAGLEKIERASKRQAARSSSANAPGLESFASEMSEAGGLAREIAETLGELTPSEGQMASGAQRDRARGLGDRQGGVEKRTREIADEAGQKSGQVPGLEKAESELREAADQMGKAKGQLGKGGLREAIGNQRDAIEKLSRLRNSMQDKGGGGNRRDKEPVRIPGADDSAAPREWRQELMEAMREKAPERYKDEVRRYYEELVK